MNDPRSIAGKSGDPVEFAEDGVRDIVGGSVRKTRRRPHDDAVTPTRGKDADEESGIKLGPFDKDRDRGTQYVKIQLPDDVGRRLRVRNRLSVSGRLG